MQIFIEEKAANWYKEELDLEEADHVRFTVRYGGVGGNVPGFSLGLSTEKPEQIHCSTEVAGVLFYIEEKDAWYFEDKDLRVSFDEELDEPYFIYD